MSERRFGKDTAPPSDAPALDPGRAPEGPLAMLVERFGQAGARRIIQRRVSQRADGAATSGQDDQTMQAAASHGLSGAGGPLPHGDAIQKSFGKHDVGQVQAHTDGPAAEGASAMGAEAFATGSEVAFSGAPSLHTAAHEAAHVVQQQAGVQLKRDDGAEGGAYEQHADAVADRVVRGESAEALLDQVAPGGARGGAGKSAPGGVQRKIKRTEGDVLGDKQVAEILTYLEGSGIDMAAAKQVALELLSTARVIPLQEALQTIKTRAAAGAGGAGGAAQGGAAHGDGGAAQGGAQQAAPAAAPAAAQAPRAASSAVSARPGNVAQSAGGDRQATGGEGRDQNIAPEVQKRGAEGAAAKDLGPKIFEVQALLGEIKSIKANVPWGTTRIRVSRAIEAFDGLLNVAVGATAIAGDFATMGMATPIMGGVVLAKDAAFGAAREHLAGGVSGEASAQSTATNVAIPQVKAMIGPISAGGVNMVPLAGGAAMAGKGVKQIYSAISGELPPGAAGDQKVFDEIKSCRSAASTVMAELQEKQAVLHDGGLANVIAQIAEFIEWLNRQEEKSRKRFIKRAPGPVGRGRAGAGESRAMMSAQHSEIMPVAALKQSAGEAGSWARFKSAVGAGESTYQQILALVQKHEGLAGRSAAETGPARGENAQKIYELCMQWLGAHDSEKETPKFRAIVQVKNQARQEAASVAQIGAGAGASSSAAAGPEAAGGGEAPEEEAEG